MTADVTAALPQVPNSRKCSVYMCCASSKTKARVDLRLQEFQVGGVLQYAAKMNFSGDVTRPPFTMACTSVFPSLRAAAEELRSSARPVLGSRFVMCHRMRDELKRKCT